MAQSTDRTFDEVLSELSEAAYSSALDATSGYWSLKLEDKPSYLTTFNTSFGRYRYLRVPFGLNWGRLDLAVLFTPSTPYRYNRNQVHWNTCAGVRRSTPSSKVVQTEQSRDLFQNKMAEHCLHCTEIFFSLCR